MNRVDQRYSTGRRLRKPRISGTGVHWKARDRNDPKMAVAIRGRKPPTTSWVASTASRYIGMAGTHTRCGSPVTQVWRYVRSAAESRRSSVRRAESASSMFRDGLLEDLEDLIPAVMPLAISFEEERRQARLDLGRRAVGQGEVVGALEVDALGGVALAALVVDESSRRSGKAPPSGYPTLGRRIALTWSIQPFPRRARAAFTWLERTASSSWLADSRSGPV